MILPCRKRSTRSLSSSGTVIRMALPSASWQISVSSSPSGRKTTPRSRPSWRPGSVSIPSAFITVVIFAAPFERGQCHGSGGSPGRRGRAGPRSTSLGLLHRDSVLVIGVRPWILSRRSHHRSGSPSVALHPRNKAKVKPSMVPVRSAIGRKRGGGRKRFMKPLVLARSANGVWYREKTHKATSAPTIRPLPAPHRIRWILLILVRLVKRLHVSQASSDKMPVQVLLG